MLEKLFGSRLRARVIGWLFTHPDERFFVRQLTKLLDEDSTNLSRELAKLEELGFLTSRLEGRQKYYQANTRSPMFEELKGLAVKTTGLADHLRKALRPLTNQIRVAFIHGSFARGQATAESDIDLILVGRVTSRDTATTLGRTGTKLGREINHVVYDLPQFFFVHDEFGERVFRFGKHQFEIFLEGQGRELVDCDLSHLHEVRFLKDELELAALDPGDIEERVNEGDLRGVGRVDFAQRFPQLFINLSEFIGQNRG